MFFCPRCKNGNCGPQATHDLYPSAKYFHLEWTTTTAKWMAMDYFKYNNYLYCCDQCLRDCADIHKVAEQHSTLAKLYWRQLFYINDELSFVWIDFVAYYKQFPCFGLLSLAWVLRRLQKNKWSQVTWEFCMDFCNQYLDQPAPQAGCAHWLLGSCVSVCMMRHCLLKLTKRLPLVSRDQFEQILYWHNN